MDAPRFMGLASGIESRAFKLAVPGPGFGKQGLPVLWGGIKLYVDIEAGVVSGAPVSGGGEEFKAEGAAGIDQDLRRRPGKKKPGLL